jgi:hypothetical protein
MNSFLNLLCRHQMAAYGLGICDGAEIANRQPSFALKLDRNSEVEHLTSSRTIANTLLPAGVLCPPKVCYQLSNFVPFRK